MRWTDSSRALTKIGVYVLTTLLFALTSAHAQEPVPDNLLKQSVARIVASYDLAGETDLSTVIREMGYKPTSEQSWRAFPPNRKLELVYKSAEAAVPTTGNKAIAYIASKLSAKYDSLRTNAAVQEFIGRIGFSTTFKFELNVAKTIVAVPPTTGDIIKEVAKTSQPGRLGGTYGILTRIYGLDENTVEVILETSTTSEEALIKGINKVPPAQQRSKLRKLIAEMVRNYPSNAGMTGFLGGLKRKDDLVECFCGARSLGTMKRSECREGTLCQ